MTLPERAKACGLRPAPSGSGWDHADGGEAVWRGIGETWWSCPDGRRCLIAHHQHPTEDAALLRVVEHLESKAEPAQAGVPTRPAVAAEAGHPAERWEMTCIDYFEPGKTEIEAGWEPFSVTLAQLGYSSVLTLWLRRRVSP